MFDQLAMDLLFVEHPRNLQHEDPGCIFVVVDRLTGYTWGGTVRKEGLTAIILAEFFLKHVG